jgi:hypothetical protein
MSAPIPLFRVAELLAQGVMAIAESWQLRTPRAR